MFCFFDPVEISVVNRYSHLREMETWMLPEVACPTSAINNCQGWDLSSTCSKVFAFSSKRCSFPEGSYPPLQPSCSNWPQLVQSQKKTRLSCPVVIPGELGLRLIQAEDSIPCTSSQLSAAGRASVCWFTSGLRTCALVLHTGMHVTVTTAAGNDHGLHKLQSHLFTHMHGHSRACGFRRV